MQLKNQNNQNSLLQQVNNFANEIKRTGKTPEQLFNEMMSSGKFSQQQIDEAKRKAQSVLNLFGK